MVNERWQMLYFVVLLQYMVEKDKKYWYRKKRRFLWDSINFRDNNIIVAHFDHRKWALVRSPNYRNPNYTLSTMLEVLQMYETRATEGCERKKLGFFSNNLVILHQGKLAPYYNIYWIHAMGWETRKCDRSKNWNRNVSRREECKIYDFSWFPNQLK